MVLFLQAFSQCVAGGGRRLLESLRRDAPLPSLCVCTEPKEIPSAPCSEEISLPIRPHAGRWERSRFLKLVNTCEPLFAARFQRGLEAICDDHGVSAIHVIPHSSFDFEIARRICRQRSLGLFVSVHDDVQYAFARHPWRARAERAMHQLWQEADARFVISAPLGDVYCARYGRQPYAVVTDGLATVAATPREPVADRCNVHFMGLFHLAYEPNLRALLTALDRLAERDPSCNPQMTCRCGVIQPGAIAGSRRIRVLPFSPHDPFQEDCATADLLYLPLPFAAKDDHFSRYSLSTKMVSYLGSGIPILFHGPEYSAAYQLLRKHDAAFFLTSNDPATILAALTARRNSPDRAQQIASNALELARTQFMAAEQQTKFWAPIIERSGQASPPVPSLV